MAKLLWKLFNILATVLDLFQVTTAVTDFLLKLSYIKHRLRPISISESWLELIDFAAMYRGQLVIIHLFVIVFVVYYLVLYPHVKDSSRVIQQVKLSILFDFFLIPLVYYWLIPLDNIRKIYIFATLSLAIVLSPIVVWLINERIYRISNGYELVLDVATFFVAVSLGCFLIVFMGSFLLLAYLTGWQIMNFIQLIVSCSFLGIPFVWLFIFINSNLQENPQRSEK